MGAQVEGHRAGKAQSLPQGRRGAPLRIALAPLHAPDNSFVASFADALRGDGAVLRDHRWEMRALLTANVVLLHWPNALMGRGSRRHAVALLARMRIARAFGTRFVWIAHNLRPHDGASDFPAIPRAFVRALDGIIYLSKASRRLAHELYDIAAATHELVTVHGRYQDLAPPSDYVAPPPGAPVRLLAFGLVRPYKNLDWLIDAVAGAGAAIELTILGKAADPAFAAGLRVRAGGLPNVRLDLRAEAIPQAELERAIDAAHAVVLPYREILNSGSAIQALGRHRPVLVPARGTMPELQAQIGQEWVHLYEGEIAPATMDRLAATLAQGRTSLRPDLARFDWAPIGAELRAFVHAVARSPRRRGWPDIAGKG